MTVDLDQEELSLDERRPKQDALSGKDLLIGVSFAWGIELLLGVLLLVWGGISIQI